MSIEWGGLFQTAITLNCYLNIVDTLRSPLITFTLSFSDTALNSKAISICCIDSVVAQCKQLECYVRGTGRKYTDKNTAVTRPLIMQYMCIKKIFWIFLKNLSVERIRNISDMFKRTYQQGFFSTFH